MLGGVVLAGPAAMATPAVAQMTTVAKTQPTIAAVPRTPKNLFTNPVFICPCKPPRHVLTGR
jgi:hypothetical protein